MTATKQQLELPDQLPAAESETNTMDAARPMPADAGDPDDKPPSPAAPAVRVAKDVPPMTMAIGRRVIHEAWTAQGPAMAANDAWLGEVLHFKGRGRAKLTLTIIGGGPACISGVEELLQAPPAVLNRLAIFIVDDNSRDQLGRGAPFRRVPGVGSDYLYMNMYTESVQLNKLTRLIHGLLQELGVAPMSDFMKRCHVGDALALRASRVLHAVAAAGLTVTFIQGRAVEIQTSQDASVKVVVREADGTERGIESDAVMLTIGNEGSSRYHKLRGDHFIDAPWSQEAGIHLIPATAKVAIAGTSLSGMDVASVLLAQGHTGDIVMFSRSAKLAGIRPLHAPTPLKVLSPERLPQVLASQKLPLSFRAVVRLLKMEFEAQGFDWAELRARRIDYESMAPRDFLIRESQFTSQVNVGWGILKALDDVIAPIWQVMSPEAREFVLNKLTKFSALQWSAVPPTAHRVMRLLHENKLTILKAGRARRHDEGGFAIIGSDGLETNVDYFVDATGFAGGLHEFKDRLIVSMCDSGFLTPDDTGRGAKVSYADGRLLDQAGNPTGPIWAAAGALTRGAFLLSNELGEATHSATRCARGIISHFVALIEEDASAGDAETV
ncbi:FAD/NAD(P)-binding protein [Aquabacterium sp. OR-4]|uniref:FAD/NAD(P)-binding protein n=1 Tax=Aquabacterium sp. OR-4 TaxID=2978127 RepID=UPI0028CA26F7|nr:FAD/NAD(P)-binding protein [Aquabacterium sp. OR-4]MDT7836278.1 FAD/NAD(P)-binding protein [Aquabacterium sp. OR-4]